MLLVDVSFDFTRLGFFCFYRMPPVAAISPGLVFFFTDKLEFQCFHPKPRRKPCSLITGEPWIEDPKLRNSVWSSHVQFGDSCIGSMQQRTLLHTGEA